MKTDNITLRDLQHAALIRLPSLVSSMTDADVREFAAYLIALDATPDFSADELEAFDRAVIALEPRSTALAAADEAVAKLKLKVTRGRVHVDLDGELPDPVALAAFIAPRLLLGDKIAFTQRHKFDAWGWLIELDAALHDLGAYDWADAVSSGPLYLGNVHIEGLYWDRYSETVRALVNCELMAVLNGDGKAGQWGNTTGGSFLTKSCCRVSPDRWEPGDRRDTNLRSVSQHTQGIEHISFRDNRNGLRLAALVLIEMAAEGELVGATASAAAETEGK